MKPIGISAAFATNTVQPFATSFGQRTLKSFTVTGIIGPMLRALSNQTCVTDSKSASEYGLIDILVSWSLAIPRSALLCRQYPKAAAQGHKPWLATCEPLN